MQSPSNPHDDWAGILAPDEHILWQGRPSPKLRLEFRSPIEPLFFTFFTGFSVFWMVMASKAGGFFWVFGLLFFAVGSYNLLFQHFWKAYLRTKMHYSLSNQRAFIATRFLGKQSLKTYPITPHVSIELQDGPFGAVMFASETKRGKRSSYEVPIGFEMIPNAREVYRKIVQIQMAKTGS
jgi:hypothetical protein